MKTLLDKVKSFFIPSSSKEFPKAYSSSPEPETSSVSEGLVMFQDMLKTNTKNNYCGLEYLINDAQDHIAMFQMKLAVPYGTSGDEVCKFIDTQARALLTRHELMHIAMSMQSIKHFITGEEFVHLNLYRTTYSAVKKYLDVILEAHRQFSVKAERINIIYIKQAVEGMIIEADEYDRAIIIPHFEEGHWEIVGLDYLVDLYCK